MERLVGVCDSGLAINPMLAERAVEAGMIFGLSNAMSERITLAGGAPEQTNFDTYQVLRMDQAPDVTVEIISVGDEPGSFGEVGTMPMCAAVATPSSQPPASVSGPHLLAATESPSFDRSKWAQTRF